MLQKQQQSAQRPGRNLHVGLATSQTEVLEAQKLRYRVFADEMGARLTTRSPGVDRDLYDAFCEHLIVRDEDAGRIVGTYRILSPSAAREAKSRDTEAISPAYNTFQIACRTNRFAPSLVGRTLVRQRRSSPRMSD